jgi:hypothetical protein
MRASTYTCVHFFTNILPRDPKTFERQQVTVCWLPSEENGGQKKKKKGSLIFFFFFFFAVIMSTEERTNDVNAIANGIRSTNVRKGTPKRKSKNQLRKERRPRSDVLFGFPFP